MPTTRNTPTLVQVGPWLVNITERTATGPSITFGDADDPVTITALWSDLDGVLVDVTLPATMTAPTAKYVSAHLATLAATPAPQPHDLRAADIALTRRGYAA